MAPTRSVSPVTRGRGATFGGAAGGAHRSLLSDGRRGRAPKDRRRRNGRQSAVVVGVAVGDDRGARRRRAGSRQGTSEGRAVGPGIDQERRRAVAEKDRVALTHVQDRQPRTPAVGSRSRSCPRPARPRPHRRAVLDHHLSRGSGHPAQAATKRRAEHRGKKNGVLRRRGRGRGGDPLRDRRPPSTPAPRRRRSRRPRAAASRTGSPAPAARRPPWRASRAAPSRAPRGDRSAATCPKAAAASGAVAQVAAPPAARGAATGPRRRGKRVGDPAAQERRGDSNARDRQHGKPECDLDGRGRSAQDGRERPPRPARPSARSVCPRNEQAR